MKYLWFLCLFLALPVCAEEKRVEITRADNSRMVFSVEVADTPEAMEKGLMFRTQLAGNRGMLFDFGRPIKAAMWMKNTLIPLDMLFIAEGGVVRYIAENTVPESTDVITAGVPVRYVLELRGGTAENARLRVGDTVSGLPVIP